MAYSVFTPPVAPKIDGASQTRTVRMAIASFGDGYKQQSPDGLNPISTKVSVSWPPISKTNADTIDNFLLGLKGMPFKWTPPGASVQRQWTCVSWTRAPYLTGSNGLEVITAEFEEDFSL